MALLRSSFSKLSFLRCGLKQIKTGGFLSEIKTGGFWSEVKTGGFLSAQINEKLNQCNFSTSSRLNDIFTIQDENDFQERVLKSDKPVILDFYATWCGPCKTLMPRLESVIGGKVKRVHLAKVDIDENEKIAEDYQVTSVPTVFAIKNGKVVDQFIGAKDEDELRAFVSKLINE